MSPTTAKIPKRSMSEISSIIDNTGRSEIQERALFASNDEQRRLQMGLDDEQRSRRQASQRNRVSREKQHHKEQREAETFMAHSMFSFNDRQWDEDLRKTAALSKKAAFYSVKNIEEPSSDAGTRRRLPVEYRQLFDRAISLRDELRPILDELSIVPQKCQYLYRIAEEVIANLSSLPSAFDVQAEELRSAALNMRRAADVVEGQHPAKSTGNKRRERKQKTREYYASSHILP